MTPALQLSRTTMLLLLTKVSGVHLVHKLYQAVDAIEVGDEAAPAITLRALEFAKNWVKDPVLQMEIRRAIDALEDEMKAVKA